jgi:hypothetical protein
MDQMKEKSEAVMIILFLYKTDQNCVRGTRQWMFASEGPLIGFPPSIGAILRKKCRQHNALGHASCHVVLLARNCCVATVLSYFVVDALLGRVCRDRARDCTTDSSPQSIALTTRPCLPRVAPVEEQNFLHGRNFTLPKNVYISPQRTRLACQCCPCMLVV